MIDESISNITERRRKILKAFSRALQRESHVLTMHPDLLWQQMYNRLTWEDAPDGPIHEICEQARAGRKNWLRLAHPLPAPAAQTSSGQMSRLTAVALTPDGKYVICGAVDGNIFLWDLGNEKHQDTLVGHSGRVNSLHVTLDGQYLLSGSDDHTLKLWDLAERQLVRVFDAHRDAAYAIGITPDGRFALSAALGHHGKRSQDNSMKWWDLGTGLCLQVLNREENIDFSGDLYAARMTRNGKYAVSGAYDTVWNGEGRVWDLTGGNMLHTLPDYAHGPLLLTPDERAVIYPVEFPDQQGYIIGEHLRMVDLESGRVLREFSNSGDRVVSMDVSDDSAVLAASFQNGMLWFWDLHTGKMSSLFTDFDRYASLRVVPASHQVISCPELDYYSMIQIDSHAQEAYIESGSYAPVLWASPLNTGKSFQGSHRAGITGLAFTPDARYLVTCSNDRTIKVWDIAGGQAVKTLGVTWPEGAAGQSEEDYFDIEQVLDEEDAGAEVTALAIADRSRTVMVATWDCRLEFRDLDTGKVRNSQVLDEPALHLAIDPHVALAASGSESSVSLWDLESGKEISRKEMEIQAVLGLKVTTGGVPQVCVRNDDGLHLVDMKRKRIIRSFTVCEGIYPIPIAPVDEFKTFLAIVDEGEGFDFAIIDESDEPVRTFNTHGMYIYGVLSQDGSRLLTWSQEEVDVESMDEWQDYLQPHFFKLWNTANGRLLRTFNFEQIVETKIGGVIHPDNRTVFLHPGDKCIWRWNNQEKKVIFAGDVLLEAMKISADGKHLVCGDEKGNPWIFEWVQ